MLRSATCRPIRYSRSPGLVPHNQETNSCRRAKRILVSNSVPSRSFVLSKLANRFYRFRPIKFDSLPLEIPIDEETFSDHRWETYFHPDPGDVLYGRYELKVKIGYGSSSTVWLALDLASNAQGVTRPKKYVAIKIKANNYEGDDAWHEMGMCHHIATAKPYNPYKKAHPALLTAIDHFIIPTRRGSHLCMVFDPMRESLGVFKQRLSNNGQVTPSCLPILKRHLRTVLAGIEYLHSECRIIHTDLKMENILMTFEDHSVLDNFVQVQTSRILPRKVFRSRAVYQCQNNFGDVKDRSSLLKMTPKLADFGLAQDGNRTGPFINPIQPDRCHAPEVLLGTGWSFSADIWNFGVMVWELLTGQSLFMDPKTTSHPYSATRHMSEMISILGPAPTELLEKEKEMRHWMWMPEVFNAQGKLCNTVVDYYGGPFFSDDGKFIHEDLIANGRRWEDESPACIVGQEKDMFFRFMRRMLRWQPEDRPKARELMDDPWLNTDIVEDTATLRY